jgi:hypothetical protein
MTKQEFIQRNSKADRGAKLFNAIYIPLFLVLLIANVFFVRSVPEKYTWHYLIAFFGFLFVNLIVTLWVERRRIRKFGLLCPNCNKAITKTMAQVAIATGNCGSCGIPLFAG